MRNFHLRRELGRGLAKRLKRLTARGDHADFVRDGAYRMMRAARVLTYLSAGAACDVALLSLTRGEGGQNALGPEQAPQLGLIRTQELLAATRGYGVKLYFTRAKDFGFCRRRRKRKSLGRSGLETWCTYPRVSAKYCD